jgi:hypothetical protein
LTNFLQGTSNEAYHSNKSHLSSSSIKLLLKDPAAYKYEYIDGNRTNSDNPNFLYGTLVHSLILEPDTVTKEYAVYEGLRKAGKAYEKFVQQNDDKKVVSIAEMTRAEKLYQAFVTLPVATQLISGGFAEHSMIGKIIGVDVKSRADYINITDGYIVDVKTTSGGTNSEEFQHSCDVFGYDLSAALYCDIAAQVYGKLFDFYFIVLSKSDGGCAIYKASSSFLTRGQSKVITGLVLYKKCLASGVWQLNQPQKDFSTTSYEIEELP